MTPVHEPTEHEREEADMFDDYEEEPVSSCRVRGRAYHRFQRRRKIDRLVRAKKHGETQYPCRNRIVILYDENCWFQDPKYKYPYIIYGKDTRKQFLKKLSRRKFRRSKNTYFSKGNGYRRTFDYWWLLY